MVTIDKEHSLLETSSAATIYLEHPTFELHDPAIRVPVEETTSSTEISCDIIHQQPSGKRRKTNYRAPVVAETTINERPPTRKRTPSIKLRK